jgi:hypothetical protein
MDNFIRMPAPVIFQPAAVGTTETTQLFAVKKGERVIHASFEWLISAAGSTDSTMELGDGSDTDGFVAATDTEQTAGDLTNGAGAYFATSGGKLYNVDDTVDIKYTNNGTPGATNPKVRVRITIAREMGR